MAGLGAGNYRYLDVLKALEWIRDNAAAFGGDSENVTLCGQSAGSSLVSVLLASPLSEGLIQRACLFSSSAILSEPMTPEAYAAAQGLTTSLEGLMALPAREAVDLPSNSPLIDGYVLDQSIPKAYRNGVNGDVDVLVCVVPGDAIYFTEEDMVSDEIGEEEWLVGRMAMIPLCRLASGGSGRNFICMFGYAMNGAPRCEHTDDLPFWFNTPVGIYGKWDEDDYAMADIASDYLVNFATSGDPNGGSLPRWDAATGSDGYAYLRVDTDASCKMERIDSAVMDLMAESFGLES